MKKLSLASIITAAAMIMASCNGNSNTSTTSSDSTNMSTMNTDTNTNNNMASTDTTKMSNNSNTPETDFANDAGAGGMMEVELGQLAEKNGSSPAVKNFGKMMVTDHSKLNDELKDLAAKKNITLPTSVTSDQQNDIDKLTKETGKDFDKDYVSMMVDDHKKDIDAFEKAQDKITDTDFKVFITKALPVLHKHLNAIEQIKKHM